VLISNAYAQAGGGGGTGSQLFFIIIMCAAFYFFFIRPQRKKVKEHDNMVQALATGDEIVTNGGIAGRVTQINDSGYIMLEVAENVEIRLQKTAISMVLPKGSLRNMM